MKTEEEIGEQRIEKWKQISSLIFNKQNKPKSIMIKCDNMKKWTDFKINILTKENELFQFKAKGSERLSVKVLLTLLDNLTNGGGYRMYYCRNTFEYTLLGDL